MEIRDRLRRELVAARAVGDPVSMSVLRSLLAAIDNAEAVDPSLHDNRSEVQRRHLSDADITDVLRREVDELRHAAAEHERAGAHGEAVRLQAMADIAERYAGECHR